MSEIRERKGQKKERKEKEKGKGKRNKRRKRNVSYLWHFDCRDSLDQEVKSVYTTRATRGYQN